MRIRAGTAASLAMGGCGRFWGTLSERKAVRAAARFHKPGEKLNIGVIGVGGKGWSNWEPMFKMGENIVALCDVDQNPVEHAMAIVKERNADVKGYSDYRKMLDRGAGSLFCYHSGIKPVQLRLYPHETAHSHGKSTQTDYRY